MDSDLFRWIQMNSDGIRWIQMYFQCEGGNNDDDEWAQVAARLPLSDGLAMHSQVSDPPYVTIHYNEIHHTLQTPTIRYNPLQ